MSKVGMRHPIQPLEKDRHGRLRFKANEIVRYLLDHGGIDLNDLAAINFSQDDREQFAQLIGYSLDGFAELSYVGEETFESARRMGEGSACADREGVLREQLKRVKDGMREAVATLYEIHPDDLGGS